MNWPNLPEDYGEGQRQFDMASAAMKVAELATSLVGICTALAVRSFTDSIVASLLAGGFAAIAFFWPYRRRLDRARKLWDEDRRSYESWRDSLRS